MIALFELRGRERQRERTREKKMNLKSSGRNVYQMTFEKRKDQRRKKKVPVDENARHNRMHKDPEDER